MEEVCPLAEVFTRRLRRSRSIAQSALGALVVGAVLALCPDAARSDHVDIVPPGAGSIALIVGPAPTGAGPANVNFAVSAPNVGNGTPVNGTPNILIEVGVRPSCFRILFFEVGLETDLQLRATAPAALQSGIHQIPIDRISWTTVLPNGANMALIPSGTFASGTTVYARTFPLAVGCGPRWMGGLLTFHFANDAVYPEGTYEAQVEYTAQVP
ncbi:MAG TPA: hypothetical protein VF203_00875 [Burkholderiales bacterium]